ESLEFHRMIGPEGRVGGRKRQVGLVGAVDHQRVRGLTRGPGNNLRSEAAGGGDVGKGWRGEIGMGDGDAGDLGGGVKIIGFDGVAVADLEGSISNGRAGGGLDYAGKNTARTGQ